MKFLFELKTTRWLKILKTILIFKITKPALLNKKRSSSSRFGNVCLRYLYTDYTVWLKDRLFSIVWSSIHIPQFFNYFYLGKHVLNDLIAPEFVPVMDFFFFWSLWVSKMWVPFCLLLEKYHILSHFFQDPYCRILPCIYGCLLLDIFESVYLNMFVILNKHCHF
jgi:hypothetical protein